MRGDLAPPWCLNTPRRIQRESSAREVANTMGCALFQSHAAVAPTYGLTQDIQEDNERPPVPAFFLRAVCAGKRGEPVAGEAR